jgi:hypothetical protein
VDSNAILPLARDATLGGRLAANEQAVISYVTRPELRSVVARGQGLRGVPRVLDIVPVVAERPSLDLIINIRGQLVRTSGRFGDGIIGVQSVEFTLPLITDDAELSRTVQVFGGVTRPRFPDVRYPTCRCSIGTNPGCGTPARSARPHSSRGRGRTALAVSSYGGRERHIQ